MLQHRVQQQHEVQQTTVGTPGIMQQRMQQNRELVNDRTNDICQAAWWPHDAAAGPARAALVAGSAEERGDAADAAADKVSYASAGRLAIVGPLGPAFAWADR